MSRRARRNLFHFKQVSNVIKINQILKKNILYLTAFMQYMYDMIQISRNFFHTLLFNVLIFFFKYQQTICDPMWVIFSGESLLQNELPSGVDYFLTVLKFLMIVVL